MMKSAREPAYETGVYAYDTFGIGHYVFFGSDSAGRSMLWMVMTDWLNGKIEDEYHILSSHISHITSNEIIHTKLDHRISRISI